MEPKRLNEPKASESETRRAWRVRMDEECPYPGESVWREAPGWSIAWDRVSREFRDGLPSDVLKARELEETARNIRRWVELAFVDGDAKAAAKAGAVLKRLGREVDLAFGIPRSAAKRRRYYFMQFLEWCVREGLSAWPRFDDPNAGQIPATGPDGEEGWVRLANISEIRVALDRVGDDLSRVPLALRDELVAAWSSKKPGPKVTGSKQARGAYAVLGTVLRLAWGDKTTTTQLKREWSIANPWTPRNRS